MVDRCVCCGEIIPEGRMICIKCENETSNNKYLYVLPARHSGKTFYKELWKRWKELIGLKN